MEVFDINGQIISPLAGKTLYVAGDSIAYGKSSAGGYGKCIADKYGMTLTNEAVDGATLTPNITDKRYTAAPVAASARWRQTPQRLQRQTTSCWRAA